MEPRDIISILHEEFPGKAVMDLGSEIIAETDPTQDHEDRSTAIAYIKESAPHHHLKTVETYHVEEGQVNLVVEGEENVLNQGDTYVIIPPQVHYAKADWARVRVDSEPGWTIDDHILEEEQNG